MVGDLLPGLSNRVTDWTQSMFLIESKLLHNWLLAH